MEDNKLDKREEKRSDSEPRAKDRRASNRRFSEHRTY